MRRAPLFLLAATVLGCGKTVTDDDCRKVADHMREVWLSEAKKAAPTDGPASEKAGNVIKAEGDKLVADWAIECKKDLVGKRADPKEVECLLKAKTIEQIGKCGEP